MTGSASVGDSWTKSHRKLRKALYTPMETSEHGIAWDNFTGMRKTVVYYEDGTQDVIQDNFKQSSHPGRLLPKKWKGHTTFEIKVQSHEKQGESARQVVMHQNEHPPFLDPNVIESFEAQVLGGKEPTFEAYSSHSTGGRSSHQVPAPLGSHAVPDTACRKTLIGDYTLREMERHVEQLGGTVCGRHEVNTFRFGNSGELVSSEVAMIPSNIGGRNVVIHAAVLPGAGSSTPLLLSKELLKWLGCVMNMNDDEMFMKRLNTTVKLGITERGHYAIPLFSNKSSHVSRKSVEPSACLLGEDFISRAKLESDTSSSTAHEGTPGQLRRRSFRDGHAGSGRLERHVRGRSPELSSQELSHRDSGQVRQEPEIQNPNRPDLSSRQTIHSMGEDSHSRELISDSMYGQASAVHRDARCPEKDPCEPISVQSASTTSRTSDSQSVREDPNDNSKEQINSRIPWTSEKVPRGNRMEPTHKYHGDGGMGDHWARRKRQSVGRANPCEPQVGRDGAELPEHEQRQPVQDDADVSRLACLPHAGKSQHDAGFDEMNRKINEEYETLLAGVQEFVDKLRMENEDQRYDLLQVNLNSFDMFSSDVTEVFSMPRVNKMASMAGLTVGQTYDIRLGCNLLDKKEQDRVLLEIEKADPILTVICPPCDPFSILQNFRRNRNSKEWLKRLYEGRVLLRFAMRTADQRRRAGKHFLFEQPKRATSWQDRTVQQMMRHEGVEVFDMDQCMFGLKDRISHMPHQKGTRIMTTSKHIKNRLWKACDGKHSHQHVMGKVKLDGSWVPRSHLAQEYPDDFCRAVCLGIQDEQEERKQSRVTHSVLAIEDLGCGDNERKIANILKRCHDSLGHPSLPRFMAMLRAARANEKVLTIAKGLTCSTCEALKPTKSHRVAKLENATQFNQVVCCDMFEVELPWRKLKMLNIVDAATRYQMVIPLWKGAKAEHVRKQYRRSWLRWAGPPIRLWLDGGSEFGDPFSSLLEHDGMQHEASAAWSPWQNGVVERHGGIWKTAFHKTLLEHVPNSKHEVEEICDHVTVAHNSLIRKDGFSPAQHVLGTDLRLPGLHMTGQHDEVIDSALRAGEKGFERRFQIRCSARKAFMEADSENKMRVLMNHRNRPSKDIWNTGDLAFVWRKGKGKTCFSWHGPGHVIGRVGSRIWVSQGLKVYRCSLEHLRRPSEEQESLIRLLPEHLRVLRSEAAERGAGNVVVLSDQHVPPSPPDETGEQVPQVSNDDDDELEKDLMQEFGMGVGVVRSRPESHDDELQELQHVAQRPRLDNTLNPHVGMSTEEEDNDRNSLGTQESEGSHVKTPYSEGDIDSSGHLHEEHGLDTSVEQITQHEPSPQQTDTQYGPIRTSSLTRAMRHSLDLLDHGRLRQHATLQHERDAHVTEMDSMVVIDDVFLVHEKKKGRKEVIERTIPKERQPQLKAAKEKEWAKMLNSKAVVVHTGAKAQELIREVGVDRLLQSRFVITNPDDEMQLSEGILKARWCIRGYLDPDRMELQTSAPTLSAEGFAVVMQALASFKWGLVIGDIEGAFLKGDPIFRKKGIRC